MKKQLAELIRSFNQRGWAPATSTNYSFIDAENQIWISKSGKHKGEFTESDFMTIDNKGLGLGDFTGIKPSDETKIHLWIYRNFKQAKVILHSHGIYPVLLSFMAKPSFRVQGYELQKGFNGCQNHLDNLAIPIMINQQNMDLLCMELDQRLNEIKQYCFIIEGHGTYAWGENIFDAQRHLETLDYLCQSEYLRK